MMENGPKNTKGQEVCPLDRWRAAFLAKWEVTTSKVKKSDFGGEHVGQERKW